MNELDLVAYQEEAKKHEALSNPLRVWIFRQLADGREYSTVDLSAVSGVDAAEMNQHLDILKKAGLAVVQRRQEGVFCRRIALEARFSQVHLKDDWPCVQKFLDSLPVCIYIEDVNLNFKHVLCNRICAELVGKTVEEVIGRTQQELFTNPEEIREFQSADLAALKSSVPTESIQSFTDVSGKRHIGKICRTCLDFPDGRKWLLGIVFDITSEAEQQERIASLLKLFEHAVSLAALAPFRCNLATREVIAPAHFSNFWPLHDGKIIPVAEYVIAEDQQKITNAFQSLCEGRIDHISLDFRSNYHGTLRYFKVGMNTDPFHPTPWILGVIQEVTDFMTQHIQFVSTWSPGKSSRTANFVFLQRPPSWKLCFR
ncbi:MAG: PAS domain-containing protein [Victivallaceae bacterium]|nr:PAS domain-containing protein [Victivallaceae bacterium]